VSTLTTRSQFLYIGNDPLLSKASSDLLRTAGYKVRATNPSHVGDAVREHRYLAVILCATLSAEEMNTIVDAVQQSQPEIPIISIQVGQLGDGPHPASAVVVDALLGPQAFLAAVHSVTVVRRKIS